MYLEIVSSSQRFVLALLDTSHFAASDETWQDGYIHVIIRQLPRTPDIPPNKVKLELVVVDTGKVRMCCHPDRVISTGEL
jgi:hypothetical protein